METVPAVKRLEWLADEIEAGLGQAYDHLEDYLRDPTDEAGLKSCIEIFHGIAGALRIAECRGPLMLAEEMGQLAEAQLEGDTSSLGEACEVLMEGMLKLPAFMRRVIATRADQPTVLITLLNDMRAVRGGDFASESQLFSPDLAVLDRAPAPRAVVNTGAFKALMKKLWQLHKYALSGLIRDEQRGKNLDYLGKVYGKLESLSEGTGRKYQWLAARAVLEGLRCKNIQLTMSVRFLLQDLEGEFVELVKQGPRALALPVYPNRVKNLLYYVAISEVDTQATDLLRKEFRLDDALPDGVLTKDGEESAPVCDTGAIQAIVTALLAELDEVKRLLDRHILEGAIDDEPVREALTVLKRMADTLVIVGRDHLRRNVGEARNLLERSLVAPDTDAGGDLASVAALLVEIERGLQNWEEAQNTGRPSGHEQLQETDEIETADAEAVLKQAILDELEKVKESLIDFHASQWDVEKLVEVPSFLRGACGALEFLHLERPRRILEASNDYIGRQLLTETSDQNWPKLDALADVIASVEYFLESLGMRDEQEGESILASAESSLAKLGFTLPGGDSASFTEPDDEVVISAESEVEEEARVLSTDGDALDAEILEIFLDEAEEVQREVADNLVLWSSNFGDGEALAAIQRGFHTLKGSGRMVGAIGIGELAWSIENLLNQVIDKRIAPSEDILALLERVRSMLPLLVLAFQQGDDTSGEAVDQLVGIAEAIVRGENPNLQTSPEYVEEPEVAASEESTDLEIVADVVEEKKETVDPELLEIFFAEANTHLDIVADFVREQQQTAPIYRIPTAGVQRALHTLKGSERVAGITELAELSAPTEEFVRDLCDHRVNVDADSVQLLADFVEYTHVGLVQVKAGEPVAIAQQDAFLTLLAEQRRKLIDPVRYGRSEEVGANAESDVMNLLMTEGMSILIDPDKLLSDWENQPGSRGELLADLAEKLSQLAEAADGAGLSSMAEHSAAMQRAYEALRVGDDEPRPHIFDLFPHIFDLLFRAHNLLLNMANALAAGQDQPDPDEEMMAALLSISEQEPVALLEKEPVEKAESFEREDIALPDAELPEIAPGMGDAAFELSDEIPGKFSMVSLGEEVSEDDADPEQILPEKTLPTTLEPSSFPAPQAQEIAALDAEIIEIFLEEADDLLEKIDRGLHAWQENPGDMAEIDRLKRSLHTLKGGARMAGLLAMGDLSHVFETLVIDLSAEVDAESFQRLFEYQDQLMAHRDAVKSALSGAPAIPLEAPPSVEEIPEDTESIAAEAEPRPPQEVQVSAEIVPFKPPVAEELAAKKTSIEKTSVPTSRDAGDMIKVPAALMEGLINLAGETSIARSRIEAEISEFSFTLNEMETTISRLRDQLRRLSMGTEAQIMFRQEQIEIQTRDSEFDPLEMDRYSQLQQLTRSLFEAASDLRDLKTTLSNKARDTESILHQQSRINADLHEGLMRTRMVPFARLVPRLRRTVRQTAQELGKQVDLYLSDVEGEVDRSIMDRILSPLEHMLRNAIGHGIETPEERRRLGKPEKGVIDIQLAREGGDVLLRLADDGRGLDIDAIRKKAVERGLMPCEANLSDQEIAQFIFQPGFSTSSEVTKVSGRGVGMDVVNSEVRQLGGTIAINTEVGLGTEFQLRLPFTVSVNRALMVKNGQDLYALPLNTIEGVVRLSPKKLQHYYHSQDEKLEYGGDRYDVRYIGSLLNEQIRPRVDISRDSIPLILTRIKQRCYAVQVDELVGSDEIVVKTLGRQFSTVQGLSGATVLGDGRVVIILDLMALLRLYGAGPVTEVEILGASRVPVHSGVRTIMVVDDSVTVRKVTSRLLERERYRVLTARDGQDALRILQDDKPDVMLLDIEMPRMDGFEVASRMRSTRDLRDIPVIMITSRTGDKHREQAMSLGVKRYLGKPYHEETLLGAIQELLADKAS